MISKKQHILGHCGFLSCSDNSLCGRVIAIRRWISENADSQPSGVPSLHMFWSVGSCKSVSLVYIKSLNISSTLCSVVGVWKLFFEWFSFFFFFLWPITLPSLSFTFIYINSFVILNLFKPCNLCPTHVSGV